MPKLTLTHGELGILARAFHVWREHATFSDDEWEQTQALERKLMPPERVRIPHWTSIVDPGTTRLRIQLPHRFEDKNDMPKAQKSNNISNVRIGATKVKSDDPRIQPNWQVPCLNCGSKPTVPLTGLCGPCTFGEADTAGGNW